MQVLLEDVNENHPVLEENPLLVHVSENNLVDMHPASGAGILKRVVATDADAGLNAALNYSIELLNRTCSPSTVSASAASSASAAGAASSNSHLVATSSAPLLIDPSDGTLHAAISFDREICSQYNFQVFKLSNPLSPNLSNDLPINQSLMFV